MCVQNELPNVEYSQSGYATRGRLNQWSLISSCRNVITIESTITTLSHNYVHFKSLNSATHKMLVANKNDVSLL